MSNKVWITAKSELVPFNKLSDEHLDNAIEWCKIRLREMRNPEPAVASAAADETVRVSGLLKDLEAEKSSRGGTVTITADFDGVLGSLFVKAGEPMKLRLKPGQKVYFQHGKPKMYAVYFPQWSRFYCPSKGVEDLCVHIEDADKFGENEAYSHAGLRGNVVEVDS